MAQIEKTLKQQIDAMRAKWPEFELAWLPARRVAWFGNLVGVARPYRVMIEYGPPISDRSVPLLDRIPLVRVLHPRLEPQWDAPEEAPLPHVFFNDQDITLSPLCLFDPDKNEWTPADLIARTTVFWTIDWSLSPRAGLYQCTVFGDDLAWLLVRTAGPRRDCGSG